MLLTEVAFNADGATVGAGGTGLAWTGAELLLVPDLSVAVAVMTFCPAGTATGKVTLKLPLQSGLAAVVTVVEPRKV